MAYEVYLDLEGENHMERQDADRIISFAIDKLLKSDAYLLRHDVFEVSITHRMGRYVEEIIRRDYWRSGLNVDCEYNKNFDGDKNLELRFRDLGRKRQESVRERLREKGLEDEGEDALHAFSTRPDIIVHKRGSNDMNTIVIEAKKHGGSDSDYAELKLKTFTLRTAENPYGYEHGALIEIVTGVNPDCRILRWFSNGAREE